MRTWCALAVSCVIGLAMWIGLWMLAMWFYHLLK